MSESIPAEVEVSALDNEPGPSQVAVIERKRPEKRPYYYDDIQVVLQASHTITTFPLTLFNIFFAGGWTDVQNPSSFSNSGVPIFQKLVFGPSTRGLDKCGGFRQ